MKKVAVIAICNFIDNPTGGEVTFLNSILKSENNEGIKFNLIGMSNNKNDIVGSWNIKDIGKNTFDFLPVFKEIRPKEETKIPYRIRIVLGLLKYRKLIYEEQFDYIYIHCPEIIIGLGNKIIKNSKLIYHVHGEPSGTIKYSRFKIFQGINLLSDIYIKLIDKCIEKSTKVIWVSKRGKEDYSRISRVNNISNKSIVISNPYDSNLFNNTGDREIKDYIECIFVGRLSKGKNLSLAINALKKIEKSNVIFTICGDGEEKANLEKLVIDLELTKKVRFYGRVNRNELPKILKKSDIFLMPSLNEGSPVCIPEALAMGNAVISTDVGDISEIIKNDYNGILLKDFEVDSFSNAIIRIIDLGLEHIQSNSVISSKNRESKEVFNKIITSILLS